MQKTRIGLLVLGLAASFALGGLWARQASRGTRRIPQFENEHVKAWTSIITPRQPLTMHRHEHPRALVALKGGTITITKQGGPSQAVVWETGKAYWLTADPPGELHADVNDGPEPVEVVVVELQKER